ncbi:MAG TPA: hypothetical protein VF486_13430 [Actinomycetes bacterium]
MHTARPCRGPEKKFGFEVTSGGWVVQAAVIAAWTIGKRGREVVGYYRRRGGHMSW